ncbi:Hypothetical protein, putative, partial [Bodo saltans]
MPLDATIIDEVLRDVQVLHTSVTSSIFSADSSTQDVRPSIEKALCDVLTFSANVSRSEELFAVRGLSDRQQQAPLSFQYVRNITEILIKYCEVLLTEIPQQLLVEEASSTVIETLTVRSLVSGTRTEPIPDGIVIPQALSLLLNLASAKTASRIIQQTVCGTVQYIADALHIGYYTLPVFQSPALFSELVAARTKHGNISLAAASLRHEGNANLLFHWFVAVACLTQSRHQTHSIRLARLCEIFASIPDDDSDRDGVVEVIKNVVASPSGSSSSSNTVSAATDQVTVIRTAMRFVAFSLCSLSRCAALVEGSGRFYSEMGRIGSVLPLLALHGSPALFAIASSLLNVLSSDGGRMFDADPSIGEFLSTIFRERLLLPSHNNNNSYNVTATTTAAEQPQASYSWYTHGVRHWFGDLVMRGNISTGHKLDGALAVKCRELTKYFVRQWASSSPKGASETNSPTATTPTNTSASVVESFAMSIARSIGDKSANVHLLDTGVSHLLRLIALDYTMQMQRFVDGVSRGTILQADLPRALFVHWRSSLSSIAVVVSDGGAHRMASALLLLVQTNILVTSVNGNGESESSSVSANQKLSRCERSLLAGFQQEGGGDHSNRDQSLLANVCCLLSTIADLPSPDPRLLCHVLHDVSMLVEAAWHQSPRDLAPHILELNLLATVHKAALKLMSLAPTHFCSQDASLKEVKVWLDVCVSLCGTTVDVLELHEGIRDALCPGGNHCSPSMVLIASTFAEAWLLSTIPLDKMAPITEEHNVKFLKQTGRTEARGYKETLEHDIERILAVLPSGIFSSAVVEKVAQRAANIRALLEREGSTMESSLFWQLHSTSLCIATFLSGHTPGANQGEEDYIIKDFLRKTYQDRLETRHADWPRVAWDTESNLWLCEKHIADIWETSVRQKFAAGGMQCEGFLEPIHELMKVNDLKHVVSFAEVDDEDKRDGVDGSSFITTYPLMMLFARALFWYFIGYQPTAASMPTSEQEIHSVFIAGMSSYLEVKCAEKSVVAPLLVNAMCDPVIPSHLLASRFHDLLPLAPKLPFTLENATQLIDSAMKLLKSDHLNEEYQTHLCTVFRCALTWWAGKGNIVSDETLSDWLTQADVVTSRTRILQSLYDGHWHRVPLAIALEVYAHLRLLADIASRFLFVRKTDKKDNTHSGERIKVLWDDVTSRVRTVLAEMVSTFLIAIPDMPISCVNDALPILERLALDVTQSLQSNDVISFWTRVVRGGVLDRPVESSYSDNPTSLVPPVWLFRILSMVASGASREETDGVVQANPGRAANLSMLLFMMVDIIACRVTTLSEQVRALESEPTLCAALACADSLITAVWAALEPEITEEQKQSQNDSMNDSLPQVQCRKNLHVFLQHEALEQGVVLPLIQRVANPALTSDVFYERTFRAVLEAMRVAARASVNSLLCKSWHSVLCRLQVRGCAALEQLCYINQSFCNRVCELLHDDAEVTSFLANSEFNSISTGQAWEQRASWVNDCLDESMARDASALCNRLLNLVADDVARLEHRIVAETVVQQIVQEVRLLPTNAQPSIVSTGPPRGAIIPSSVGAEGINESTTFIDAAVMLTELAVVSKQPNLKGIMKDFADVIGFVVFEEAAPSAPAATASKHRATAPAKSTKKTVVEKRAPPPKKGKRAASKNEVDATTSKDIDLEPPVGKSKLWCFLKHTPGTIAVNDVDRAILRLAALNALNLEIPPLLSLTVAAGEKKHPFVQLCDRAPCLPSRKYDVVACCEQGMSAVLVAAVLRHCSDLITALQPQDDAPPPFRQLEVLEQVETQLSGCFRYLANFEQRSIAIALKQQDGELRRHLSTVESKLFEMRSNLRRPFSRLSENAWCVLLFLHLLELCPLADLSSCRPKFNLLLHGYLRMDRYGAADDRNSFDDDSRFSDLTSPSGNHSTNHSSSTAHDSDEDEDDASAGTGAPGDLFQGNSDEGDEGENEEDNENEFNEEEEDGEARVFGGLNALLTPFARLVQRSEASSSFLQEIVSFLHSKSDAHGTERPITIEVPRGQLLPELRFIVPLGKNSRFLRYFDSSTTPLSRIGVAVVDVRNYIHSDSNSPVENALHRVVCAVTPFLLLRGKVANKLLLHILGQLCTLDNYLMIVLTHLMDIACIAPRARLIVLRLVYTIAADRRTLGRAAPSMTLANFSAHDSNKVIFFQRLLSFLAQPTMSVLSQRMVTYVLSSTYGEDENDDEIDWDASEAEEGGDDDEHEIVDGEGGDDDEYEDVDDDDEDHGDAAQEDNDNDDSEDEGGNAKKLDGIIKPTHQHNGPALRPHITLPIEESVGSGPQRERHMHPLVLMNIWEVPEYLSGTFQCDVCHHSGGVYSYHCSECQYDECMKCVIKASVQRPIGNDDFDLNGGTYYEPTDDYEIQEREHASTNVFAHDQFLRYCHTMPTTTTATVATSRPWEVLLHMIQDANCVDGCTNFLVDAIGAFLRAAVFPWHHPTQKTQPPFLPEVSRADVSAGLIPLVCEWAAAFLDRRSHLLDQAKKTLAVLEAKHATTPHLPWDIEIIGDVVYSMDSLHAEAIRGSQALVLVPLCADMCPDQQMLNVLDGLVQRGWDVLTSHYSLLTTFLKKLGDDDKAQQELYGTVTMSQGNVSLLTTLGKYYRVINWRNAYVAHMSGKAPHERLHQVPLKLLVSTAGPSELRTQFSMMQPSDSELFGLDDVSTPVSTGGRESSSAFHTSEATAQQQVKKSELLLEVLARRRGATAATKSTLHGRPTTANNAAATAAKEVKAETEDPWDEERSEEIASIVGFAKSYRRALNFLIASRNDPSTTLDSGVDFLLNTSKILEFSIRLAAYRAKMEFLHENADDECDVTVTRDALLVATFREMSTLQGDLMAAAKKKQKVNAMETRLEIIFADEEAMDAGGVKREWLTLVFQRIIQLTDQSAAGQQQDLLIASTGSGTTPTTTSPLSAPPPPNTTAVPPPKTPFSDFLDEW